MLVASLEMAEVILFAEVFKIKLGSIPNGADPMVEWFFLFSDFGD